MVPFISAVDELSIDIWPFGSGPVKFLLRCLLQGLSSLYGLNTVCKFIYIANIFYLVENIPVDKSKLAPFIRFIDESSKVDSKRIILATGTFFNKKSLKSMQLIWFQLKSRHLIALQKVRVFHTKNCIIYIVWILIEKAIFIIGPWRQFKTKPLLWSSPTRLWSNKNWFFKK